MIHGKNILITGASSGIGHAIAHYLGEHGANLIVVARRKEKLESLQKELNSNMLIFPCDLDEVAHVDKIFQFCKSQEKKLDGIVHCAGQTIFMPLKVNNIEKMRHLMRLHVEVLAQICKFASSKRYVNDDASIVAISSISASSGYKGTTAYSASKAAMNTLIKSAAMELSYRNIRINAIAPATVGTETYFAGIREMKEIEDFVKEKQPLGLINPIDLAYLAEFLLSDKSKYISGDIIKISAGYVL